MGKTKTAKDSQTPQRWSSESPFIKYNLRDCLLTADREGLFSRHQSTSEIKYRPQEGDSLHFSH